MPEIRIHNNISEIERSGWDRVSGRDPFANYAFYHALEESGSVDADTGWQPLYLCAYEGARLAGVMPLFLKWHSYGEYVFDHAFADAYERAGGDYYPKLLAAAPFTPVQGLRIFAENAEIETALLESAIAICHNNNLSSLHINFCTKDYAQASEALLARANVQYHFFSEGYGCFDDFLGALTSAKRKTIRRERRLAQEGIRIKRKTGDALTATDWECFWACYQDTGARKWGSPYLTRAFFESVQESMPENIMMVLAYQEDQPVASALNFYDENRLLGRYWGTLMEKRFLHFELSYYQAIEFAIERGIPLIEAGAQGEHKIARGYRPVIINSYHHFAEPRFHEAIRRYLREERRDVAHYCQEAAKLLPFKSCE